MSEEELEKFRSVVVTAVGFAAAGILTISIFRPGVQPSNKFEVVDKYQGCEVVRYTDPSNGWNYFLDCRQR
jgi:hypothetical protein